MKRPTDTFTVCGRLHVTVGEGSEEISLTAKLRGNYAVVLQYYKHATVGLSTGVVCVHVCTRVCV